MKYFLKNNHESIDKSHWKPIKKSSWIISLIYSQSILLLSTLIMVMVRIMKMNCFAFQQIIVNILLKNSIIMIFNIVLHLGFHLLCPMREEVGVVSYVLRFVSKMIGGMSRLRSLCYWLFEILGACGCSWCISVFSRKSSLFLLGYTKIDCTFHLWSNHIAHYIGIKLASLTVLVCSISFVWPFGWFCSYLL